MPFNIDTKVVFTFLKNTLKTPIFEIRNMEQEVLMQNLPLN